MKFKILIGNIAAGKSSYSTAMDGYYLLSKDKLRSDFGEICGIEYLWNEVVEQHIHNILKETTKSLMYLEKNLLFDETNMTVEGRREWILLAKEYNYDVEAVLFPDAGIGEHVRRRMSDGRGFDEQYWADVYLMKKQRYQTPSIDEGFDRIITI